MKSLQIDPPEWSRVGSIRTSPGVPAVQRMGSAAQIPSKAPRRARYSQIGSAGEPTIWQSVRLLRTSFFHMYWTQKIIYKMLYCVYITVCVCLER